MHGEKKEDWRDFEKRRKGAQKAGYGQAPVIPRAQVGSSRTNFGYDGGPGDYQQQHVPFSYTNGSQPSQQQWNAHPPPYPPGHQIHPAIVQGSKVSQPRVQDNRNPVSSHDDEEFLDDGLVKRRKCRDIICLAMFAAFMCLMAAVAISALMAGNYKRLSPGHKNDGCGKSTPMDGIMILEYDALGLPIRPPQITKPNPSSLEPNVGKVDVPQNKTDYDGFFDQVADEMKDSWPNIVYMCLVALGFSILMTILLRIFAGVIIWTVVVIFVIIAVGVTAAIWIYYATIDNLESGTFWDKNRKEILLVCAILVTIVAALFLLVLLAMRRRIALLVRLFKEAGKAVHAMPVILIQPVWTFLCTVIVSALFTSLAVLIETSRTEDSKTGECKRSSWATSSRYLNIFAYLWMLQFIIGCQHMVIAGAIAQWYFIRNKSRLGFPILTSFKNVIRYHLGSIAFGSLIIAILKFIRFILNQIKKRLAGTNCCLRCLICCCQCFFWCLDNFLQFINRNAYIEIAIYGYAFCPAAKKAFKVISTNALRLAAINSIGDFVLFLGKLCVVALTATCGYYMLHADLKSDNSKMDVEWAIIFIGAFFAYYIANCFLSVYEMAIDTIFICYCEDTDMNDGVARPYFMNRGLMEFMKSNEKLEKKNKKNNKSE